MKNPKLVNVLLEANNFLSEFCWLFNFANINVFQEIDQWPTEWKDFLQNVSPIDKLKDIMLNKSNHQSKVPFFVQTFVMRRNVLKVSLLDQIFETEVSVLKNLEIPDDLRRGMTPKKQHEVAKFSQHIRDQVKDKRCLFYLRVIE